VCKGSYVKAAVSILCREEVVASLNEAIDNREEGLIIKHPHSTYQPDKRKGILQYKYTTTKCCSHLYYSVELI